MSLSPEKKLGYEQALELAAKSEKKGSLLLTAPYIESLRQQHIQPQIVNMVRAILIVDTLTEQQIEEFYRM